MNHFTRRPFSRSFALFIALTLAVPGNALALREIQTKNSGLEEQELTAALKSPAPAVPLTGLEEGDLQQHPVAEEEKRWSQDMEEAFQGWYGLIFAWRGSWDKIIDFDKEWRAVGRLRTTWHQRPASLPPVDGAMFEEFLEKGLRSFLLTEDVNLPRDIDIVRSGVNVVFRDATRSQNIQIASALQPVSTSLA